MTLDDLVQPGLEYLRGLFPRRCDACGRCFETYEDYVARTQPGGSTCFDESRSMLSEEPVGTLGFAHCPCGSTLSISSEAADSDAYRCFIVVLQREAEDEGTPVAVLLDRFGAKIRARALASRAPTSGFG